jgi:hypothetical protein
VGAEVVSQVAREPTPDSLHGRASVASKLGVPDFTSREVQSETDEELIEVMWKGESKMRSREKTQKESQIENLAARICELRHKE